MQDSKQLLKDSPQTKQQPIKLAKLEVPIEQNGVIGQKVSNASVLTSHIQKDLNNESQGQVIVKNNTLPKHSSEPMNPMVGIDLSESPSRSLSQFVRRQKKQKSSASQACPPPQLKYQQRETKQKQIIEKWQMTEQQAREWMSRYQQEIPPAVGKTTELQKDLEKEKIFQNDNYYIQFFSKRTSDYFRNRYVNKVLFSSNSQETPRSRKQHVFIFDWDDTLLCTSYLSAFQFQQIGADARATIGKLDECVRRLLNRVKEIGSIYVITNAAKGWVEYSSKLYLPRTHDVLKGETVISARSMFGEKYPGDYAKWKIEAFKTILSTIDKYTLINLICIGDSNIQMEAAHCLSKELQQCLVKTIKFRENPKPEELLKQQELVYERINDIFQSTKNLTIRLERRQNSTEKA